MLTKDNVLSLNEEEYQQYKYTNLEELNKLIVVTYIENSWCNNRSYKILYNKENIDIKDIANYISSTMFQFTTYQILSPTIFILYFI